MAKAGVYTRAFTHFACYFGINEPFSLEHIEMMHHRHILWLTLQIFLPLRMVQRNHSPFTQEKHFRLYNFPGRKHHYKTYINVFSVNNTEFVPQHLENEFV